MTSARPPCADRYAGPARGHEKLPPRNGRLSVEQLGGQCFDCLAYLKQPDADSVEYQAIRKVAALQMRTDGIYRGREPGHAERVPSEYAKAVS
jgi:hypothetical protein